MVTADFEEKSYETAYNVELASGLGGNPRVFSPGQVLEKLTGFDAAADPGPDHLIWRVLRIPRPPGLSLLPAHWSPSTVGTPRPDQLPSLPVSLILQFKRPEYLRGATAKQWRLWYDPYYRFKVDPAQHNVLRRLERRLDGVALVRYAAPAFHRLEELEVAQVARTIIEQSGHVSPEALGGHRVWTYQSAGAVGRGNPTGQRLLFETLGDLLSHFVAEIPQRAWEIARYEGLESHLATLAAVCRDREPRLRAIVDTWARSLWISGIAVDRVQALADFASVQTLVARERSVWWLLDRQQAA
ncbi:hypothetical protein [Jiangella mangrovi]|uniref:Uncharacterized protein n=1 Tax=Jiangella mangrovi TaxID=1524084 RepID=A0A7W9LK47_9ACTN|nr:hypothetical protein [Jiangella mangrovi]MBB5786733.1 hypothetical protein [Jiangella mangrovi]